MNENLEYKKAGLQGAKHGRELGEVFRNLSIEIKVVDNLSPALRRIYWRFEKILYRHMWE